MAIKELLEFVGKQNIADDIKKDTLAEIGERVKRQFDEDWASMADWMEGVSKGIELMKQEFKTKSTPFPGASNFKSPMLFEASISFGDKSSLEILRSRNLIKGDIIGKDRRGEKKKLSERIVEAMNYQVNYDMPNWRKEQKRLLYTLPSTGCMFKKISFNPLEGTVESNIIQYPDFAVNQATTSIERARSFTQILAVDNNGAKERMALGIWSDIKLYPEDADGDEGSNEAAQAINSEENTDRFLEQHCWADLDDDGKEEPYIITIHEQSSKIVRIIPRYDERSFVIKTPEGVVTDLTEAIKGDAEAAMRAGKPLPEEADIKKFKLVRIRPSNQIIKYGFIPSPDGTFLDLGYSHLLGAITQGVNTTTNQLTDSGRLRNIGGGFLSKGFRKKKGPVSILPGEWISTDVKNGEMVGSMLPNPSPEPSQVLFALNEKMEAQGRNLSSVVDIGGQIQANTAPTTALAMIQESLITVSASMGRILDSMSEEFQLLFEINKRTFDPKLYKKILDDPEANAEQDFNESLDIIPTASPEMSSKLQRIQLATVEIQQVPLVVQAGGNPMPIVRNFFERIGSDNVDEIFPEQPTDQQAAEIERFTAAQEQQNKIQLAQLEFSRLQTEVLMREQARLDADTQRKIEETIGKLKQMNVENILTLEKAESEEVKNQINVYTAQVQSTIDLLTATGEANATAFDRRNPIQAQQGTNNSGRI